jgi:hypothetical protein
MLARTLFAAAVTLAFATSAAAADTSLGKPSTWIDRMTAALWPSPSVSADATLTSKDTLGSGLDTEMKLVRTQSGERVRTQIRVIAPEGAKGTVYEVFSNGGKLLDRTVYFPALDRARDVSGIRRTDAFLGSQFSYEDLEIAAPVESSWRTVESVEEGGRKLVRVASAPYSYYSRVETLIDPKTNLPVRISYYDRAGRLFKRATFGDIQKVDGHPMPLQIEMTDVQSGAKSELRLHDVKLNAPVDEKIFSESPIQKRRKP